MTGCTMLSLIPRLSVSEWPRRNSARHDVDNGAVTKKLVPICALTMFLQLLRAFMPNAFVLVFSHVSKLSTMCAAAFPETFFFSFFCSYDFIPFVEKHIQLSAVDAVYSSVRVLFLIVLAFALFSVFRMRQDHFQSKITLLAIFAVRMVPSILISMKFGTVADPSGPGIIQIVGDGLYLAVLTSDLIIAKIANRQVHVLLPVIALASVISHHVSIVAACIYHITIIYDLCTYLQVRCGLHLYLSSSATPPRQLTNFILSAPPAFPYPSRILRWCV
jgi:hypothetical protein